MHSLPELLVADLMLWRNDHDFIWQHYFLSSFIAYSFSLILIVSASRMCQCDEANTIRPPPGTMLIRPDQIFHFCFSFLKLIGYGPQREDFTMMKSSRLRFTFTTSPRIMLTIVAR